MRKYLFLFILAPLFAATPLLDEAAISQWLNKVEPGSAPSAILDIRAYLLEKGNPDVLRDSKGKVKSADSLTARWKETRVVDTVVSLLRQCPTADEECAWVELSLVRRVMYEELKAYTNELETTVDVYADQIAQNNLAILDTSALEQLLLTSQAALLDATNSLATAGFSAADIQRSTATLNRVIAQVRGLLGV